MKVSEVNLHNMLILREMIYSLANKSVTAHGADDALKFATAVSHITASWQTLKDVDLTEDREDYEFPEKPNTTPTVN